MHFECPGDLSWKGCLKLVKAVMCKLSTVDIFLAPSGANVVTISVRPDHKLSRSVWLRSLSVSLGTLSSLLDPILALFNSISKLCLSEPWAYFLVIGKDKILRLVVLYLVVTVCYFLAPTGAQGEAMLCMCVSVRDFPQIKRTLKMSSSSILKSPGGF